MDIIFYKHQLKFYNFKFLTFLGSTGADELVAQLQNKECTLLNSINKIILNKKLLKTN